SALLLYRRKAGQEDVLRAASRGRGEDEVVAHPSRSQGATSGSAVHHRSHAVENRLYLRVRNRDSPAPRARSLLRILAGYGQGPLATGPTHPAARHALTHRVSAISRSQRVGATVDGRLRRRRRAGRTTIREG